MVDVQLVVMYQAVEAYDEVLAAGAAVCIGREVKGSLGIEENSWKLDRRSPDPSLEIK